MFSPFLNGLGSTIDGMPWLCSMSPAQWAIPLRTLPPPVSKKRFSAVGLVSKKLVGAMASRNKSLRSASARPPRPPGRGCRRRRRAQTRGRDTPASPSGTGGCLARPDRRSACPPSAALPRICPARSAGTAGRPWAAAQQRLRLLHGRLAERPQCTRDRAEAGPASRPDPRTASAPSAPPASCAASSARFSRGSAACARRGCSSIACASAALGRRPLAAGFACFRPLGPVLVNGASPCGVVMILSPRSSRCPLQLRRGGRRRRLIADTTSRLPPAWRARKSFSSYIHSCPPDRVNEPTNGTVIRDLRLCAAAARLREVPRDGVREDLERDAHEKSGNRLSNIGETVSANQAEHGPQVGEHKARKKVAEEAREAGV